MLGTVETETQDTHTHILSLSPSTHTYGLLLCSAKKHQEACCRAKRSPSFIYNTVQCSTHVFAFCRVFWPRVGRTSREAWRRRSADKRQTGRGKHRGRGLWSCVCVCVSVSHLGCQAGRGQSRRRLRCPVLPIRTCVSTYCQTPRSSHPSSCVPCHHLQGHAFP